MRNSVYLSTIGFILLINQLMPVILLIIQLVLVIFLLLKVKHNSYNTNSNAVETLSPTHGTGQSLNEADLK